MTAARSSRAVPRRAGLGPARSAAGLSAALADDVPVGEIWFEAPADAALLVKYLFTSERLSIQVHPDDAAGAGARPAPRQGRSLVRARRRARRGDRARADPRGRRARRCARRRSTAASRRCSTGGRSRAATSSIRRPARSTPSAAASSLIEIQQNLDFTYRLYDYGRPRELHVDEAVAVAMPGPWSPPSEPATVAPGRRDPRRGRRLHARALDRAAAGSQGEAVVVPIAAGGSIDGEALDAGSAWSVGGRRRDRRRRRSTCWSPRPA